MRAIQQTTQPGSAASGGKNVGNSERWISALGGGLLLIQGLRRRSLVGVALATAGGGLLYRGFSGHCPAYEGMGVQSPAAGHLGVMHVARSITIRRSAEDLYQFWRHLENLPRVMSHLASVREEDEGRSHWVAHAPGGRRVEWDAEIYEETPGSLLAWRSLPGADVINHGEVRFAAAPGDRGTEVSVKLTYQPPAGILGVGIAKLLGEEPNRQLAEDLRRFQQWMETEEIARVTGQTRGEFFPRSGNPGEARGSAPSHAGMPTLERELA